MTRPQNGEKRPSKAELLLRKPTVTAAELHETKVYPVSLNGIYAGCASGEIECYRIGKKLVIPTAPIRRKIGMAD
jgi:hypothetical protein